MVADGNAVVIHIENLLFRWSKGDPACLEIPHFKLRRGERVFLHGQSGSGKSTLLQLLAGVLIPERGTLAVLGTELTGLPASRRDRFRADHIGFIFQQFNLVPYLPALDNVLLPCRFSPRRAQRAGAAPREEAMRLLVQLDLAQTLWQRPATGLSVGEQQRVAAARALIGRPEIVIADEPTSALDAQRQTAFLDLLLRECDAAGATLLFVSHDQRLAAAFDRVVALADLAPTKEPAK